MPNRKFFVEYQIGTNLHCRRIRRWADENRNMFPEFGFTNSQSDFPTTQYIAERLESQFGFVTEEINGEVILRNSNPNFRF